MNIETVEKRPVVLQECAAKVREILSEISREEGIVLLDILKNKLKTDKMIEESMLQEGAEDIGGTAAYYGLFRLAGSEKEAINLWYSL